MEVFRRILKSIKMKKIIIAISFLISLTAQGQRANGHGRNIDAQKYIQAATLTDHTQQKAANTLTIQLKMFGLWSGSKAIYPLLGGTSTTMKWNLKDPQDTDAAFRITWNGTGTFASTGWTGNGSTGYGNTHIVPSTSLSTTSGNMSALIRNDPASGTGYDMGASDDAGLVDKIVTLIIGYADATAYAIYGNPYSEGASVGSTNSIAFWSNNHLSGTTTLYKNASSIASVSNTVTAITSQKIYFGATNAAGTAVQFSVREFSFVSISDGLTSTQETNLYNIVTTFKTTTGR